jgi:predicted DNA-binding protein (MmcQ/YjbR family)
MDQESLRRFCLSLPYATERVQWGNDLLFCVGDKMFAVLGLESGHGVLLSFKCAPERFAELVEQEAIIPAPYLARYHWVGLERFDALSDRELKDLIRESHEMVWAKLPKGIRSRLERQTGAADNRTITKAGKQPASKSDSQPRPKSRRRKERK